MALSPPEKAVVLKESLEDWQEVGSGGFGRVNKARHRDWGFDVAVKILKDTSHFKFDEVKFMDRASCQFVLRMYGIYEGPSGERGLVTEYMKRGSIASLQEKLLGPPPWPLAFRLAHQTAQAMNFIHSKNIVHLDLKPNNVLLSDELNARLADFGLSTVSASDKGACRDSTTQLHGTFKYMPPEAFDMSYEPVRAYDIYSFGILLWSIFSGKEPYPMADYARVELRIPLGDRPSCADLLRLKVKGIKDVVDLMEKCWVEDPRERPHFKEIIKETETLFSRHSSEILRAVHGVLTKLDSPSQAQTPSKERHAHDVVDSGHAAEVEKVMSHGASRKTKTREENEPQSSRDNISTKPHSDHRTLLESVRLDFVNSVSDPVLNQLLDLLLQERVLTSEEMDTVKVKPRAEKARRVVDSVVKKGSQAASVLIHGYCELDPCSELCDRLRADL